MKLTTPKLTTLVMTALLLSFTTGTVLARDHHDQHNNHDKRIKYQVENTREFKEHTTVEHYRSSRHHEQQPKARWAKKRRYEKRRDYIARRQLRHQIRQQAKWDRYAQNNRRHQRYNNRYNVHDRRHQQNHRDLHNRHNRVQQIVLPIPRIVFHFPW